MLRLIAGFTAEKCLTQSVNGYNRGIKEMNESAKYVKIVEWSEEDQCFVGSCPGLFYGGCHGDDEKSVFAELCELVNETIELYRQEGRSLPPATAGMNYANQMLKVR